MSSMEVIVRIDGKPHYRAVVHPIPNKSRYLAAECPQGTERLKDVGPIEHQREEGTLRLAVKVLEASITKGGEIHG